MSCELMVDVKVPYDGDKVVVNAVQSIDSLWTVELSRSNYILAPYNAFFPVDYATVVITKPDGDTEQLQLMKTGSGKFVGTTYPEVGKKYKVTVMPTGLDPVEAEMSVPDRVNIINIEWDSSQVKPPNGPDDFTSFSLPFKITFSDPPGQKNFYAIEVFQTRALKHTDLATGVTSYDTIFQEIRSQIDDPGIASKKAWRQWFADAIFDGKTYTLPLHINMYSFSDNQIVELQVRLVNMSEEYFRYLDTVELSFEVEGDPFAQPVQIYSNTSNGFGIFAGASYDVRKYKKN